MDKPTGFKPLLPQELAAFLAVEAPEHEALARDVWVESGRYLVELVSADVRNLTVDEAGVTDLHLQSVPRRGVPRATGFSLSPSLAKRVKDFVHKRSAAPTDPLLADPRGDRYTAETLGTVMIRLASRAGLSRLPARITGTPTPEEVDTANVLREIQSISFRDEAIWRDRISLNLTVSFAAADLSRFLLGQLEQIEMQIRKTKATSA